MNGFASIPWEPALTALGWTLVHFLWQGGLIAVLLSAALVLLRGRTANFRYAACCVAMGLMMVAPVATFAVVWQLQGDTAAAGVLPVLADAGASGLRQRISGALPELTLLWLIGVGILQARLVLRWSNAQRMRHRGVRPGPAVWQGVVDDLRNRLGVNRAVCLLESSIAEVPTVIGWLQPVVLVPAGVFTGLSPEQLRAVLAHELAHVRRHDYLVNLVQAVFESVLFYHPAVWWVSNRLRVEREYCCDDIAVRVEGDALEYANALSYLDELRGTAFQPALASTGGNLMDRIRRIVGLRALPAPRTGGWLAPLVVTVAVVFTASVVTIARPVAESQVSAREPDAMFREIADRDLVTLLREIDPERAEFFAVLRQAGLEEEEMGIVLKALDPDVYLRVKRASAPRDHFVHFSDELKAMHEELAAEVKAGRITEAEAKMKMERVMAEVHERGGPHDVHFRELDPSRNVFFGPMEKLHKKIQEDLAAGLITEDEAHEMLIKAHDQLAERMDGRRRAVIELIHAKLDRMRADIEEKVAAGILSEEEAAEQIAKARQKLHDHLMAKFDPQRRERMEQSMKELHFLNEEIERQLEEGIISQDEAAERLDAARRALHEAILDELAGRDAAEFKLRRLKEEPKPHDH